MNFKRVAAGLVIVLGAESIASARHHEFTLPEMHSEVPTGEPAPQLTYFALSTTTTNTSAGTVLFTSPNWLGGE